MIRLNLGQKEPEWIDLGHGVRILCKPMSTLVMHAARRSELFNDLPEDADQNVMSFALARAVARDVILDWEGVGDEGGSPVEVTPERVDALLNLIDFYDAFLLRFLSRGVVLEQEKNASAPAPSGTSAGAQTTAQRAARPARSAPTKSTSRKRAKA
jgi:hypothetical protein